MTASPVLEYGHRFLDLPRKRSALRDHRGQLGDGFGGLAGVDPVLLADAGLTRLGNGTPPGY